MNRYRILGAAICLILSAGRAAYAGDSAKSMSYDQAVAALQTLLNGVAVNGDMHTPGEATVSVTADDQGVLIIKRQTVRDQSDLRFKSETEQSWRVNAADLDPKRIAARTEPLSVYAPVTRNARRIQVTRTESKHRMESSSEDAEDWQDRDRFMTSFVSIPVATPQTADQAAALLKQIAKTSPKDH